MESMPVSKFKATCLAVLERVRKTGQPVLVTRRGEPLAEVGPPGPPPTRNSGWGAMKGRGEILGDIISPIGEEDWEALQ